MSDVCVVVNQSDDYLAAASSFSLLMFFFCSVIFKYASLTASEDLQLKMCTRDRRSNTGF